MNIALFEAVQVIVLGSLCIFCESKDCWSCEGKEGFKGCETFYGKSEHVGAHGDSTKHVIFHVNVWEKQLRASRTVIAVWLKEEDLLWITE